MLQYGETELLDANIGTELLDANFGKGLVQTMYVYPVMIISHRASYVEEFNLSLLYPFSYEAYVAHPVEEMRLESLGDWKVHMDLAVDGMI